MSAKWLNSVVYGGSKFVAVGHNGVVLVSSDNGVSWSKGTSGYNGELISVTYGNDKYLAIGNGGSVFLSSDGVKWEEVATVDASLRAVTFKGGKFYAVGSSSDGSRGVVYSSDGAGLWTLEGEVDMPLYAIAYSDDALVAVGYYGLTVISAGDGEWETVEVSNVSSFSGVFYVDDFFVAIGETFDKHGVFAMSSDDNKTWTLYTIYDTVFLNGVAYGEGKYAVVDNNGMIYSSTNGRSWYDSVYGSNGPPNSVTYGDGKFLTVGYNGKVLVSSDGVSWDYISVGNSLGLLDVIWGNNLFVGVGDNGRVVTSVDGSKWTEQSTTVINTLNGVTYGNATYIAVGDMGAILTSNDGSNWTDSSKSTVTANLNDVAYGSSVFVAVGQKGTLLTSIDGNTWATGSSTTDNDLYSVSYGDGVFLVGGCNGVLIYSEDGKTWQNIENTHTVSCLSSIAYGNNMFVVSGNYGTVLVNYKKGYKPVVSITANGANDHVNIKKDGTVSISLSLNSGDYLYDNADWWVVEERNGQLFYFDVLGSTFSWKEGLSYTLMGSLIDLNSYTVYSTSTLGTGEHTFYFGVDLNMNSNLDWDELYYDSVTVNIVE
ncbi:MAG: hypothetical protein L3V56_08590 [Candidatus Magnetoovum sp. WYHC-5]|nr:hypothetical protein [Candidatus Magnetoovum sp. WYHC-5]